MNLQFIYFIYKIQSIQNRINKSSLGTFQQRFIEVSKSPTFIIHKIQFNKLAT